MRFFIFSLCLINSIYAVNFFDVPKETYLTYDQYLLSAKKPSGIKAPSDWVKLIYSAPLIGKFQINEQIILSISVFSGVIGDELSNVNRWRAQLGLPNIQSLGTVIHSYLLDGPLVRVIKLNNQQQFFVIYWITIEDRHIFNKFVSTSPLPVDLIERFIEGQSWSTL